MAGIKNQTVCWLLRKWLNDANISQKEAASRFSISQPTLSRQLKGLESIPFSRIKDIISATSPPPEELKQLTNILGKDILYPDILSNMHNEVDHIGPDEALYFILQGWRFFRDEVRTKLFELARQETIWGLAGEGKYYTLLKNFPNEKLKILYSKYGNATGVFKALGKKGDPESIIDILKKLELAIKEIEENTC